MGDTVGDIEAAERALQQALEEGGDAGDVAERWSALGAACRLRFLRTGEIQKLNRAVECFEHAQAGAHRDRARYANNLAVCLVDRFDLAGRSEDLVTAIHAAESARDNSLEGSQDWAEYTGTLAVCLWDRYDATGSLDDLDRARTLSPEAVAAAVSDAPWRARLISNLAMLHLDRFERFHDLRDLQIAVGRAQEAVTIAAPDDPELSGWWNNLGNALHVRFSSQFGDHESPLPENAVELEDLEGAIAAYRRSLETAGIEMASRATFLSNLGNALVDRSILLQIDGSPEQVDAVLSEAIAALGESVSITAQGALQATSRLNTLGVALRFKADRTRAVDDVEAARAVFSRACEAGLAAAPEMAIAAADNWIRWAVQRGDWEDTCLADGYFTRALERLRRVQSRRRQEEAWLTAVRGLATEVAFAHARCGRPAQAATRLEQSRAVIASETLGVVPAMLQLLTGGLRDRYLAAADAVRRASQRAEA